MTTGNASFGQLANWHLDDIRNCCVWLKDNFRSSTTDPAANVRYEVAIDKYSALPSVYAEFTNTGSQGFTSVSITGAADNGSGLIRITAAGHQLITGDSAVIVSVGGTTEANGIWTVTKITSSTFDLQGSTFTHAYTSGGAVIGQAPGHGIAVIGRCYDLAVGKIDLIGVEGRIDAVGSWGNHTAGFFLNNYVGSAFTGRVAYGVTSRVELRDAADSGNAISGGVAIAFYSPSIVGGTTKYGVYVSNTIRASDAAVQAYESVTGNSISLLANGVDTYLVSSSKLWLQPLSTEYLILNTCLGFVPIDNGRKLGNSALSLAWEVHATTVNVATLQVVGARKTGWTTIPTGTLTRTTFATYTSQTISAVPTQAEVQTMNDNLLIVNQRLAALIVDLHSASGHGLLGA